MLRKELYKNMNKFRETRNKQKRDYYNKTSKLYGRNPWTAEQEDFIIEKSGELTDMEMSAIIHHSVRAIQMKRCRILKKFYQSENLFIEDEWYKSGVEGKNVKVIRDLSTDLYYVYYRGKPISGSFNNETECNNYLLENGYKKAQKI